MNRTNRLETPGRARLAWPLLLLMCWHAAAGAATQEPPADDPDVAGESFTVEGVTETVAEIMERERLLPHSVMQVRIKEELPSGFPKQSTGRAPAVASWPPRPEGDEPPALLRRADPFLPQAIGLNFTAISCCTEAPFIPPDSMGDVGPTQIVAVSNGRIKVFDKTTGALGPLNASTNTFFASVQTGGTSDPHVRYDRLSQRWFVVMIDLSGCPNRVLLAVSSGPTITGTASFTFFAFAGELTPGPHFADYPTLGVDANALYVGTNMFDQSTVGCAAPFDPANVTAFVIRKSSVTGGGPAVVTAFRGLVNYTTSVGTWTPQGADNDDPQATQGFFLGVDFFNFDTLNVFRVNNPGTTPTLSAQMNLAVPATRFPIPQVQPGPNGVLDAIDDRPFAADVHRNKITGALSLWTAHNIEVNTAGVGTIGGGRNGSRWYEIVNLSGLPGLLQAGTVFDPTATASNPFGHWIPSIAMSGQGHAAIAMSRASAVNPAGFASVVAAGRLRTGALGTTQPTSLVIAGAASYNQTGAPERWGDYSQTVVDPNDDQTMWTFQEWANSATTWGLQVTQLIAPPPATPATANPATVSAGQSSIIVSIVGTSVAGSEFFDPGPDSGGPGFANRISAAVSGGVTVNSVTFSAPTQVFLNISTVGTPAGVKDVTVTNPDGQARTGVSILTVVACPAITVNPAFVPSGTVGSLYSQTFTQSGGTAPATFGLVGALPTGLAFDTGTATLSGTPTQNGSFNFTVMVTDANSCTGSRNYTLLINCQTITVNPTTIPAGTAGTAYSQTFTQTGGVGTVTWELTGTLPTGLSLGASTGVLSGTPTQTGSFPITITARDGNGCGGSRSYTLVIGCQTIIVDPAAIPAGTAGSAYSQTFTQTNGIGTTTWSVTGTLPTGITLDPSTGVLSGTPMQTGSFPITVTATDANGCIGSRAYTLVINCQTITVDPATIPAGTAGTAYSQTFTQTSGIGTITWSVTGPLPTGISLNPTTGVLSGTPTQTGSFPIAITATDANGCIGSRAYTLVINCQTITVNPATIPAGTAGTAYSQTFTQTSGIGTITWSVTGVLPTGLALSPTTGVLSGTPTQTGSFPITVTATDANGCIGSRAVTLVINCQTITVDPATIPGGTGGVPYSQTFTQTGGIGTITWSVTGALPNGVTLNPTTGVLSGTPIQTGSFPITVTATDANGCTGIRAVTLVINCQTITVNPTTIPGGTVGSAYSQTFTQTSGIGGITWSVTGALPTGITLSPTTGVLSGTPTQTGSFPITVTATDANGCIGTRAYILVIDRAGPFVATALSVDAAGNFVFEPGETVVVAPSWRNDTGAAEILTGDANAFTGPGTATYTIVDSFADYGSVAANAIGSCAASGDCYALAVSVPSPRPAVHWDGTFVETLSSTDAKTWRIHFGASFADVPTTNTFYRFVETILHKNVTGGCTAASYCPASSTTRDQMAVFVLVSKEPAGYQPPPCGLTPLFADVPVSNPFCRWIEELARRGVVGGCTPSNYCPSSPATREQMAVFVLRTLDPALSPPPCGTPVFADVPASSPFCRWIEELVRRGVVTGCGGGNYCPASPVTREQMSVFLTVTFGLVLYGV